ncbi:MAG: DUF645 family protein [Treponema sp.]|nr:DUF645 family protein [Treponema sp.]
MRQKSLGTEMLAAILSQALNRNQVCLQAFSIWQKTVSFLQSACSDRFPALICGDIVPLM